MQATITFQVDTDHLTHTADDTLAQLWHISQANPAPFGDATACDLAEQVAHEIVRRWLATISPALWTHQARHAQARQLTGRA